MAGLSSLLNTARDALQAQSYGLNVTGQNVTNATTPLYVRREAVLQTRALGDETTGSVTVEGLRRAADAFVDRRMFADASSSYSASQRQTELEQMQISFNDVSNTGLANILDQMYASFQDLSAQPESVTVREEVLDRVGVFAARAQATSDALATQRADMLERARALAEEANARANEIAQLNQQITRIEQTGEDASDLVDQRNLKLLDLAEIIDVRTLAGDNGAITVQSAGITLVEGDFARQLSVELDEGGKIEVLASRAGGSLPATEITHSLTGGRLAGLIEARDEDLFDVSARFDQLVFDVATAINDQHQLGIGLDGVGGRNIFDVGPTVEGAARGIRVSVDVLDNVDALAAASDVGELPGGASNAVLLAALSSTNIGTGSSTPIEAYTDLVSLVGNRTASASADAELRASIFQQSEALRESLSGVSLDEEMVALQRYQRGYEAATHLISVVDQLFEELMTRVAR